ncbi:MAG: hypothetical protein SWO11_15850 [Thermodesulfobacteriota bacterium]|nr:hypothetical protein [Thermodesulfobacteriota bacterium]
MGQVAKHRKRSRIVIIKVWFHTFVKVDIQNNRITWVSSETSVTTGIINSTLGVDMDVPQGITFGSKVAVVPGYASGFTHSGNVIGLMDRQNCRWIKRGEPIAEFKIKGSYGKGFFSRLIDSKVHSVPIPCPVSGLLLHTTLKHELSSYLEDWNSMENPPLADFALLLPDDEPKPESGEYMYERMCNLVRDMSHYYFKRSRYWSMKAFSPEILDNLISLQLSANSVIFDALPTWGEYLDEARTNKPELRPYIKHLVNR